jgi:hypothetical protein
MRRPAVRAVYGVVLRLHPGGFAERFGGEMLRVFDDAAESHGELWLLGDAVKSLARQRLVRSQKEVDGAPAPFCLLTGSYPEVKAPHLTPAKLSVALLLTLLSGFIFPPKSPIRLHRVAGDGVRWEVGYEPLSRR